MSPGKLGVSATFSIVSSTLRQIFDADYYGRQAAKRSLVIGDPLQHFLSVGWRLGLNPCALFDVAYYHAQNPDALSSALNPLLHYIISGARRRARFSPWFDVPWYVAKYPQAASNPLSHYIASGSEPWDTPHPMFDPKSYLEKHAAALHLARCPMSHFVESGASISDAAPSPAKGDAATLSKLVNASWYRSTYELPPEVDAKEHYCKIGFDRGLNPNPFFDLEWISNHTDQPSASLLVPDNPSPFVDLSWSREHAYSKHVSNVELLLELSNSSIALDVKRKPKPASFVKGDLKSALDIATTTERLRHKVKARPRLAFFSHDLMWQGAQNSLFELAQELQGSGEFDVILFSLHDGPMATEYRSASIPTVIIPMRMYEANVDAIAFMLRVIGIDLVHANTTRCFEAIAAADRASIPSVWNIRESDPFETAFSFVSDEQADWIYRDVVPRASAIVFVAASTSALWPSTPNKFVIKNGINETRFLRLGYDTDILKKTNSQRRHFLTVGTFTPRKSQSTIVDALHTLSDDELARMHYTFIGSLNTPYSTTVVDKLNELANTRPITIEILPHTNDAKDRDGVLRCYAQAHCFVQASVNESYPRVILEALVANCEVIASNTFGTAEILGSDHAFLFEPGSSNQLAETIKRYLKEADHSGNSNWIKLRQIQHFHGMTTQYRTLYKQLMT
jgi:glycosyltransferase involved in cell wall biosynthesis